jgi:hypothetical protein
MTTTTELEITSLHPEMKNLVWGVAIHSADPTAIPAIMDTLMPTSARANLRAKAGTATKTPKAVKMVDAIQGLEKYSRPNGQDYYSRAWGEHTDIEVLRKARTNKQYVLLAKLLVLRVLSQRNFTQSLELATPKLLTSLVATFRPQVEVLSGWTEFS